MWIEEFICEPRPDLGRAGPVCPFVRPSLERELLSMAFHYEIDGSSVKAVKRTISDYGAKFLKLPFASERDRGLLSLLVVFPNIPEERAGVIDAVHAEMKTQFVQRGLMLGQFHPNCTAPAVHNHSFRAFVSPFPLFAMRYMSYHDILFLSEQEQWFAEFYLRFGSKYELGQVSNRGFVDMFNKAKERFPKVTSRYVK
jgi:hypothetical protein